MSWRPDIPKQGNATRNMCLSSFENQSTSVFLSLLEVPFHSRNAKNVKWRILTFFSEFRSPFFCGNREKSSISQKAERWVWSKEGIAVVFTLSTASWGLKVYTVMSQRGFYANISYARHFLATFSFLELTSTNNLEAICILLQPYLEGFGSSPWN